MSEPLSLEQEEILISEAKKNPEAFGEIYDHYYPQILRYVNRRIYNYEIAYDLTATTFHKALEKIGSFEWRNIPIAAWLYRIAGNEMKKYYRKASLFGQVELEKVENYLADEVEADTELKNAQDQLDKQAEAKKLHQSMSKLKESYHQILILRYWEKKSIREISAIIGKKEGNVKVTIHRASQKLKTIIENNS